MGGSRANTSLGVLQLVQAFLQEHASSKLAAKMATYFPEQLSERAENAGARANALVRTLEAQLYEDETPLYTALHNSEKKSSEKKKRKVGQLVGRAKLTARHRTRQRWKCPCLLYTSPSPRD